MVSALFPCPPCTSHDVACTLLQYYWMASCHNEKQKERKPCWPAGKDSSNRAQLSSMSYLVSPTALLWCLDMKLATFFLSECRVEQFLFSDHGQGCLQNTQWLMPWRYERLLASIQHCLFWNSLLPPPEIHYRISAQALMRFSLSFRSGIKRL